ncbi:MAG: AAA family ATPase [Polyangiaceae bacterium]
MSDLLNLFFEEHRTPFTGKARDLWSARTQDIAGAIFPPKTEEDVLALLRERRFVVLEGPPGTGKTRMAWRLAEQIGASTRIQFHPARTYETSWWGSFRSRGHRAGVRGAPGDLLRANQAASTATTCWSSTRSTARTSAASG